MKARPTTRLKEEHGRGHDTDHSNQRTNGDIHVGHRRHAGHGRGDDDKCGNEVGSELGSDGRRKNKVQHIAAALELVAGDAYIGEENGQGTQHARGLVVASFKHVG